MAHSPNRLLASLPPTEFRGTSTPLEGRQFEAWGCVGRSRWLRRTGLFPAFWGDLIGRRNERRRHDRNGDGGQGWRFERSFGTRRQGALEQRARAAMGRCVRCRRRLLRTIADDNSAFRSIIIRHEQVLFAQSQQSAACNASHSVERRMCRWILRMRDLAESDQLTLTQEFLAQMIGVRRSSVSIVAGTLQKARLIQYRRGNIRILDVEGLRDGCCECYGAVKAHYDRLISR